MGTGRLSFRTVKMYPNFLALSIIISNCFFPCSIATCTHFKSHQVSIAFSLKAESVTMALINAVPDLIDHSPETKKKSKIVTVSDKDAGVRRLVEYFVVVTSIPKAETQDGLTIQDTASFEESNIGSRDAVVLDDDDDEEFFVDDFDFQPVVTARFPIADHPGNPLTESVTFFCHPSGGIQLRTKMTMPKVGYLCSRKTKNPIVIPVVDSGTKDFGTELYWRDHEL